MEQIFPPPHSHSIRTLDGHLTDFASFFTALRHRWVKVERLQQYDESDFEGYRAFLRGDYELADRLVREMVKGQVDTYAHARKFDVALIRIRICDVPLSPYLVHYEIPAYEADIDCGEDIRFIDSREISGLLSSTGISDYVLYDEVRVTALVYDTATARLEDALLCEDPETVKDYVRLSDQLIGLSTPMLDSPIYRAVKSHLAS